MTGLSPIAHQIWDMKYRLKGPAGEPADKTIEDSWRRIARALARPERESALWEQRFYKALEGFRFLPAGRIYAGAGAERNVTLFNCFVMGAIPDDMGGIFDNLKEAALTMQQGGGIGYDFSTLRPKGAPVKGVGADASGPLSFMDVWDAMCRTIMSAGYRRGAMMACLRCDHPDIEAFIDAKREPGRLRMFNLSVLVSDAFMVAVKEDRSWELAFGGTVYRSLPARELWERIMRSTYAYAEPGVIFIDRINRRNNLYYCETIHATNPCVTTDTWIHTCEGPRQVSDLLGRPFEALIDGRAFRSALTGFYSTGRQPVLRVETDQGLRLRLTAHHPVRRVTLKSRYRLECAWTNAGELKPGDELVLHDHRLGPEWPGRHGEDEGYLIGLLVGDGTLKEDKAVLSVWPGRLAVHGGYERPGALAVMERALTAAHGLAHRADFKGWVEVAGRGEQRLALASLRKLALELGMRPQHKAITPRVEQESSAFYRGFLRGLFDCDGSVQGSQHKGVSVRLAQSDEKRLEALQRMLLRLGIVSTLARERRPRGLRPLPNGRGGLKLYECAAQHELVISGENVRRYAELIGFADSAKQTRLKSLLASYKRRLNRERFTVRVTAVVEDEAEAVFDVTIPGINAFDADGFYVHNCGEQPLPPYGACLLGSVNLARLVRNPFTPKAHIDAAEIEEIVSVAVRMLDNAINVSRFPLPAQAQEAHAKRRIGLGVTGLADAFILCGARYGSAQSVKLAEEWLRHLRRAAYLASAEIAQEKGAFPLFDRGPYLAGETVSEMEEEIRRAIAEKGIRNGLITSIAPTGTISLLADNVSSGIEPVFAFVHTRNLLMPDGTRKAERVEDYAHGLFRHEKGELAPLPDCFVDAQSLKPGDHLVMQAAVQKYIDSSISKTINVPEETPFAEFKDLYLQAYEMGCKGCTTYRPNPVTGAVLEAEPPADAQAPGAPGELAAGELAAGER
ncbi:MAG TPA: LAGLIDADG family homing endonuclease, partial [Alphaproteobacteria bacterium]|nr:LAGLIDADG family homing endonuclease [Alphaproteobacteria bacterium]